MYESAQTATQHPLESRPVCYRIVQPWGLDGARQSTVLTERDTIKAAFAEIDRIAAQMVTTGSPSDAIELIVIDEGGRIVLRPNTS